jgi:hypothetical protein
MRTQKPKRAMSHDKQLRVYALHLDLKSLDITESWIACDRTLLNTQAPTGQLLDSRQ